MKPNKYWKKRNRSGLTLVEIVASISLASMAIVMILSAVAQHQRQLKRVAQKKEAAQHLELQLADWLESSEPLPHNETGQFETTDQFVWQAKTINSPSANRWQARKVEIQVFDNSDLSSPVLKMELLAKRVDSTGNSRGGR